MSTHNLADYWHSDSRLNHLFVCRNIGGRNNFDLSGSALGFSSKVAEEGFGLGSYEAQFVRHGFPEVKCFKL